MALPAALNQVVQLALVSNLDICNAVIAHPRYAKPGPPTAPTPKRPVELQATTPLVLRPIDLLKTLGLAMLPPRHVALQLASWHWTLIRYGYLINFVPRGSPLSTNNLVGDYRNHHMTAVSEAFGVGCALSYAEWWLRSQIPAAAAVFPGIDLDYLIGGGPVPNLSSVIHAVASPGATRQPDYVVAAEHNGRVRLLLVECKGNSGSSATSIGQLGAAMHQLEGVSFAGAGAAVDRHAYATRIDKSGAPVELLAVDPPESGEHWVTPEPSSEEADASLAHRDAKSGRVALPEAGKVGGRAIQRLAERSLAWSGASDPSVRIRRTSLDSVDSDYGELLGTASISRLPDGRQIEVFTGALPETLDAARRRKLEVPDELRQAVQRRMLAAGHATARSEADEPVFPDREATTLPLRQADDPEHVASAIGDDGLALRIRIH